MTDKYLSLNNGIKIPSLGLGTWTSEFGDVIANSVEYAIVEAGYRHIDTAYIYKNEKEVGEGIRRAISSGKVKREDLFITTKLWGTFHDRPEKNLDISLKLLGLDYVDLYLIHWPVPLNSQGRDDPYVPFKEDGSRDLQTDWSYIQTWHEMEKLVATGKTKSIGVCNSSIKYIEALINDKGTKIIPAVNQIELHPQLPQLDLVKYCKEKGIVIEAFSPLGSNGGPLLKNKEINKIAEKYKVDPSVVLISYHVSSGRVTIPKSFTPSRILSNTKVIDLTNEDIKEINEIHIKEGIHRFTKPAWGVDLGFEDWKATDAGVVSTNQFQAKK